MAPGKRPTKLLNRRATAANKKITHRNATESPLLRLPPEIRNRIYGYVLGGNTIHIFTRRPSKQSTSQLSHSICQIPEDDGDKYSRCEVSPDYLLEYRKRHQNARCTMHPLSTNHNILSLALLQVCRQLHSETALLPYMTNSFSLCTARDLDLFVGDLLAVQRRAVCDIVVWSVRSVELAYLDRLSKLNSLTKFTLHGMIMPSDLQDGAGNYIVDTFCDETLKRLKNLSLETVNIRMTVNRYVPSPGFDLVHLEARTKEVEKKLLRRAGEETSEKALAETSV